LIKKFSCGEWMMPGNERALEPHGFARSERVLVR
jgi:hypothetical protein